MENKTYSNFLHIVNSEKWKELKQKSIHYSTMLEYLDRSEPKEKIIKDLQVLCFEINNTLRKTIDYLQLKENLNILNSKREKIYIYSKDLNETLHKCINELKTFGTTELVDYDKLYFDYLELTPKANKETSIYAYEIEKEFKEFIKIEVVEQKENKAKKDKTNELWFIVGVKFATGEMQKLYKEMDLNATQTAKHLGNNSYRPFISESVSNTNKKPQNIYSRKKKDINLILEYCKTNNLEVCQDFKDKTNHIISD